MARVNRRLPELTQQLSPLSIQETYSSGDTDIDERPARYTGLVEYPDFPRHATTTDVCTVSTVGPSCRKIWKLKQSTCLYISGNTQTPNRKVHEEPTKNTSSSSSSSSSSRHLNIKDVVIPEPELVWRVVRREELAAEEADMRCLKTRSTAARLEDGGAACRTLPSFRMNSVIVGIAASSCPCRCCTSSSLSSSGCFSWDDKFWARRRARAARSMASPADRQYRQGRGRLAMTTADPPLSSSTDQR